MSADMAIQSPECYVLAQTKFCPNNDLPYLVYRNVLPPDVNEQIASELLTKHGGWERFVRSSESKEWWFSDLHTALSRARFGVLCRKDILIPTYTSAMVSSIYR